MNKIKIHPLFVLIWSFLLFINGPSSVWTLFWAAFIHEMAHIILFVLFSAPIEKIELISMGVSVRVKSAASLSCSREIAVSLAGIAANLLSAAVLIWYPALPFFGSRVWGITCHLMLAFINMVPIEPLDGGRALYYALLMFTSPEKAAKTTRVVAFIFLIPLSAFAVWLLAVTHYNFSLLLIVIYLFISVMIKK